MGKNMKNEVEAACIRGFIGIRVCQNEGYLCGVPIIRTEVFGGLYWGPLFWSFLNISRYTKPPLARTRGRKAFLL